MSKKELFSHAATILPVSNMGESIFYYCDKLGFSNEFEWNNPVDYVVLKRGDISLHLSSQKEIKPTGITQLYVFVHDVDALYAQFKDKNVTIHSPIGTQEYGMRDFDIKDPDGHILSFGMGVS